MFRYLVSSLVVMAFSSTAFAELGATCNVSVDGKQNKTLRVFAGRALGPTHVQGKAKSGKQRSFLVTAHASSGSIEISIGDNDRTVSRGSWEAVPTLSKLKVAFNQDLNCNLTYGDPNDTDPLIEVHCKANELPQD